MTKIEWATKTWNPVTGCTKCSPGCENCYAETMARRLQKMPLTKEKYRNGFDVTIHRNELQTPLQWKKPQRIFVCSMGDLFHREVDFFDILDVMKTVRRTPQHTYLILTKRVERMKEFFSGVDRWCKNLANVWLGVTVCNQAEADEKIPVLLDIPATVRFVSVEPMLEEINLNNFLCLTWSRRGLTLGRYLDWVIVGGETGANARPMDPLWAFRLRYSCHKTETPFFFKQMSGKQAIPDDLMVREFPKGGQQ